MHARVLLRSSFVLFLVALLTACASDHAQHDAPMAFARAADGLTFTAATHTTRVTNDGAVTFEPVSRSRTPARALLATASIARGANVTNASAAPRLTNDCVAHIARGEADETIANVAGGIEQSWTWRTLPAGDGDLVVRVKAQGITRTSSDARGLHFATAARDVGVRYGRGTWVDANGQRFDVAPAYEDGAIVLRVPSDVVAHAAYPAVLDPTIGSEEVVDGPVTAADVLGNASIASIAWDGTNYLVVWEGGRRELVESDSYASDVYAARIAPDGTLLDPNAFRISQVPTADGGRPIGASFDGTNFVVVWDSGSTTFLTHVSSAGAIVDTNSLTICGTECSSVTLASDGSHVIAAWTDSSGNLSAKRISGADVDTVATQLPIAGYRPAIAFDGTNYFVALTDSQPSGATILGLRFSANLQAVDTSAFTVATNASAPVVAYGGSQYMVAWSGAETTNYVRVGTNGTVADSAKSISLFCAESPTLGFDGTDFDIVCDDDFSYSAASISPSDTISRFTVLYYVSGSGGGSYGGETMACSPTNCLFATAFSFTPSPPSSATTYPDEVYAFRVAGTQVLDTTPIVVTAHDANGERKSAVAFDGTHYLVVWEDNRNGNWDIYGNLLLADGAGVASQAFAISTAAGDQRTPAVAFTGSNFLVAWDDARMAGGYHDVYASRVSPEGVALDPTGILLYMAPEPVEEVEEDVLPAPTIAYDGTDALVVFAQYVDSGMGGIRVRNDGTTADAGSPQEAPIQISYGPTETTMETPSVAFNGTNYLAVWSDNNSGNFDIRGTLITPGGVVARPFLVIGDQLTGQLTPSVATNGTDFLVTWAGYVRSSADADIYGARVAANGTLLDATPFVISQEPGPQSSPTVALAGDGETYLVAWQDQRRGPIGEIYGASVTFGGTVLDPSGIVLASSNDPAFLPALVAGPARQMLLSYDRFDSSAMFDTERVRTRLIESGLLVGATCTAPSDCATRFCQESTCCATACDAPCQTCGNGGTCASVTNADDPDTCSATLNGSTCDATGACKLLLGQQAASASSCLSGFLSEGVCCDSACDQGCGTCTAPGSVGTCSPLAAGNSGVDGVCTGASGTGVLCDGKGVSCPGTCASDADCAGKFCNASGSCQTQVAQSAACNLATDCKVPGKCSECTTTNTCGAASCDADAGAAMLLASLSGAGTCVPEVTIGSHSCEGFGCDGTACRTSCQSSDDCANGFTCDTASMVCVKSAVCADGHTAQDVAGTPHDCTPYVCSAGACIAKCGTIQDCVNGYVCDPNGACVTASAATSAPSSSGCSCDVARTSRASSWGLAWGAIALVIARRRCRAA